MQFIIYIFLHRKSATLVQKKGIVKMPLPNNKEVMNKQDCDLAKSEKSEGNKNVPKERLLAFK